MFARLLVRLRRLNDVRQVIELSSEIATPLLQLACDRILSSDVAKQRSDRRSTGEIGTRVI